MTRLEAMRDQANKLSALLNDPQPGMITWHQFIHQTMAKLNHVYECDKEELEKL